jgi:WD40 repeat protein
MVKEVLMSAWAFLRVSTVVHCLAAAVVGAEDAKSDPAKPGLQTLDDHGDPLPQGAVARIGTVRLRHDRVQRLAYSPNGQILASAGADGQVHFWEPATGKELRFLARHQSAIGAIAFSPDGTLFACGTDDSVIILWRTATGEELRRWGGHHGRVTSLAFSPDAKLLASGDSVDTVHVWDVGTRNEIQCFCRAENNGVDAVAFSPDGKTLAAARSAQRVDVWDVSSWKPIGPLEGHENYVTGLAFAPDCRTLCVVTFDGPVQIWDVGEKRELISFNTAEKNVSASAAPDGKNLAIGRYDGSISIWDAATGEELARWNGGDRVKAIAFAPDVQTLASASSNAIRVWDPKTGMRRDAITEAAVRPREIKYSLDGRLLVVADEDRVLRVTDAATRRHRVSVSADRPSRSLGHFALSPDNRVLAFVEATSHPECESRVRLLDISTGQLKDLFMKQPGIYEHLAFWPHGDSLVYDYGGEFITRDAATGKERGRWQAPTPAPFKVAYSPDGRMLAATTYEGGEPSIWDSTTGKSVRRLCEKTGILKVLAFSADGKTVASARNRYAYEGADVVLWEVVTGRERCRLKTNGRELAALAFSPDGFLIATAAYADAVRLWDASTGEEVGHLIGHRSAVVEALAFSPDGKLLVSGSADSTILIWDPWSMIRPKKPPTDKLDTERLNALWSDLRSEDAVRAYQAMGVLARHPIESVPFLRKTIMPRPEPEPELLAGLIAMLDEEDFALREKASTELGLIGFRAEPALRRALQGKPSPEVRRRLKELVAQLEERSSGPEKIRLIRTVEALERMGTPDARKLLQDLQAGGEWSAAEDAKLALERLARRAAISSRK